MLFHRFTATMLRRMLLGLALLRVLTSIIPCKAFISRVHSLFIYSFPHGTSSTTATSFPLAMSTSSEQRTILPEKQEDENENENDDANDGEIILLSGYPFYVNGPPPNAIAQVAAKVQTTLQQVCGEQLVDVMRMGSSAIDGLAGTPVCDMLAQLEPWPMSVEAKERLEADFGYECKGLAHHAPHDEWFFGGDGKPGHLGRVVLHTVPKGSPFVQEMRAFVDYVKSHRNALERYNTVKVQGAREMAASLTQPEDNRLIGYKGKKADVCLAIKKEAMEWYQQQMKSE
jgi:GrpB-like predicted nucleotidyltransferase (UPF0157 family)